MKTIWVVLSHIQYEGYNEPIAAFPTKRLAQAYAKKKQKEETMGADWLVSK